ncbi:MAG: TRAP transporter large permease subunit [Desulfobacteraceae bacterium]|jgi:tripartite ATP-independent transporter DctM subunit
MTLLLVAIFFILCLTLMEAPLFISIAGLAMACLLSTDFDPVSLQMILIEMNRLASLPVLVALPLFTLVGCVLTVSNSPQRVLRFLDATAGWLPGGSAIAALCACAFFTALTGASGVTIVALGAVLYPILKQEGYDRRFNLGLLTTGGSLGLLFAPSLPIILYGVVAQIEIEKLFKAALVPGLLLLVVLSTYAFAHGLRLSGRRPAKNRHSWRQVVESFTAAMWDWIMIALILIGVYGGFVTIAEVSAVVLVYVLVVECIILKEIHWRRQLPSIMAESAMLSGAIIIILGMSLGLTSYLVDAQIPNQILLLLTGYVQNKYLFLAGLNIFLILVGCLMDIFSAIVIVVPIIVPVAQSYGIDLFHLAVIFLINLEIGYSTPPVGMNLFIASLKFEQPVTTLYRASLPYLALLLICLLLVTYLPGLALFLSKL